MCTYPLSLLAAANVAPETIRKFMGGNLGRIMHLEPAI